MPVTNNFAGLVPDNIKYARWDQISWAVLGFAFNHASAAGVIPLREGWKLKASSVGRKDWAGRPNQDAVSVEMEGVLMDNGLATMKTIHLLSKGPFHMRLKTQGGEYLNFVKNTATVGSPNGARNVGATYKFEVTKEDRKLTFKPSTKMFDTEWKYICDQFGSASSGGTGGSSIGTTTTAYDRNKFIRSNFLSVSVNGYDVGELEDAKIDHESSGKKTIHNINYSNILTVKNEVTLMQSSATELKAALDNANNDVTVEFFTANDETFKYTSGATGIGWDFECDDKNRFAKLMFEGEIQYGSAIKYGDTPGVAEFLLTGTGA